MQTVEDVARSVLASIDTDAGYLLAGKWVADRYRRILARQRFRHQRRLGELILPATISAGLVTATRDSNVITGDATAQAAWSPDLVGRFIRVTTVWYEIAGFTDNELRLKSKFSEATITLGGYNIVARVSKLESAARWIGSDFIHGRLRRPLRRKSLSELDSLAPARDSIGPGPEIWVEIGSIDGVKTVEIYPPANSDAEHLYYTYWEIPEELPFEAIIPAEIDPHVLVEGALIDVMRYKAGQAADNLRIEAAAFWRNEYRAQETRWERFIREAIKADRGSDDATFILQSIGVPAPSFDITNAREEIFSRGRL